MTSATVGLGITQRRWEKITYQNRFPTTAGTPVLITQVQSFNDQNFVSTRQRKSILTSCEFALEEEESSQTPHATEIVGYFVIQNRQSSQIQRFWQNPSAEIVFEATTSARNYTDQWTSIEWQKEFTNIPLFIGVLGSYYGHDSAHLRYRKLTPSGVEIIVEEGTFFAFLFEKKIYIYINLTKTNINMNINRFFC